VSYRLRLWHLSKARRRLPICPQ